MELYSQREKREKLAGKIDVYQYDDFPVKFRNQIIHILNDALGYYRVYSREEDEDADINCIAWNRIYKTMLRELGLFKLVNSTSNPQKECQEFIQITDTTNLLDIIELSFNTILWLSKNYREHDLLLANIKLTHEKAISELNRRFFEHNIGFQILNGRLSRVDSQFIHEEVVKSALTLISEEGFIGAEDEFRKAYEHSLNCRNKEAINEALKAFESVSRSICDQCGWSYQENITIKGLIDILFQKELVAKELQSYFTSLRAILESGIPTIRNKNSGHGQGLIVINVPDELVKFVLHSTAATIVFLVTSYKNNRCRGV